MTKPTPLSATIASAEQLSPDIKRFTLQLSEPITYKHGQFVNLRFPGEKRYHAFSIASSDKEHDRLEIIVKLHGDFTTRLFEAPEGAQLEALAPLGRFTDESTMDGDVVMLAGGVGVTPLLGLLRHVRDNELHDRHYWLFLSCRTRDVIIREQELREMMANPNIHVVFTLTREEPEGWDGEHGHINKAMLERHLGSLSEKTYYICGPTKMVEALKSMLLDSGVPEGHIRMESWG